MALLDRYDEMQRRPLGTNTALYRDPATESVGREYRRQQSDFGLARRLLRREARGGDSRAALGLIQLNDAAAERGIEFGGIQSRAGRESAVGRFTQARQQETRDMEMAAGRNRDALRGPVNPAATPGTRGTPLTTPEPMGPPSSARTVPDFAIEPTDTSVGSRTSTDLGQRAQMEMERRGGSNIGFRQGLDRAIGAARTPEEMDDLNRVARLSGISDTAFNRRREWWQRS